MSDGRPRRALKASATSDVTRFRGALVAAGAGASAVVVAALVVPPPGGFSSPGPLSLPHAAAKLECASCHQDHAEQTSATTKLREVPSSACERCHGDHPSTRRGHRAARANGSMTCSTCHAIHRSDQGVAFSVDDKSGETTAIRFAPGVTREVDASSFRPSRPTIVAVPRLESCTSCHDPTSAKDPIQRCVIRGQEALGGARPIACFDEHQTALPGPTPRLGDRGVCAGQHENDRAAAWEATREVLAEAPVLDRSASRGSAAIWLSAGAVAAALAFAGARGASALRARKKQTKIEPSVKPTERTRLPVIDTSTCLGCYACVDACPYDVLAIERYVAVVARPDACCGLILCEQRCPNGSLKVNDGAIITDRPRLSDALESLDVPGLYLAGDITGLPLIKNAINQGAAAVTAIAASLPKKRDEGVLDLIVVGGGPAGISAALRAKELGLSCEIIEQGTIAASIKSFPRGKLVFDQPLELPVAGKLWLKESTKEELLANWLRIVRQEKLVVRAGARMSGVLRDASGDLVVLTEPTEGGASTERRARRVLLTIGRRGTPRKLPFEIPAAVEARVHYALADARSFEGKRVVVVGLGDVAMEAAIAIARQPGTTVDVVHRGGDFSRGAGRNIAEMKRMQSAGRVTIHFDAEVLAVDERAVTVRTKRDAAKVIEADAVLVLIGAIAPVAALRAAGVKTHGEMDRTEDPSVEGAGRSVFAGIDRGNEEKR